MFLRTGTTWAQQGAKLVAKSGEETGAGSFGKSVSISGAGEYAMIGAPDDKEKTGAAWVFFRESGKTTWAQQGAKLAAKSGEETGFGEFGYSVSVAPTKGEYALMGARRRQRHRRGVGVPAHGHDLGAAGDEVHRHRRERRGRIRQERGAGRRR